MRTEKIDVRPLEPILCSIQAAAKTIGRSERSIKDMIARGQINAIKSDRRTLVLVQSLHDYVESRPRAYGTPNNYRPRALATA